MSIDINEAAEKYAEEKQVSINKVKSLRGKTLLLYAFKNGALSDASKQYWYEQFKAEQKPSAFDYAEVEKLADKELDEYKKCLDENELSDIMYDEYERSIGKQHFIKGFKSALQTNVGFGEYFIDWLVENKKLDSVSASVIKNYIPIYKNLK